MNCMKVLINNKSNNSLPVYGTPQSSGCDAMADLWAIQSKFLFNSEVIRREDNTISHIVVHPGGRALIPTENYVAIPDGFEIQVRSRSGLALKKGIFCLNSPGTIDADYRNGIGVIIANLGTEDFEIHQGDRIAQFVLCKVEKIEWIETEDLDDTERGLGGFGHTGV